MLSPDNSYDQLYHLELCAAPGARRGCPRERRRRASWLYGVREYSMRAWLDPDKISSLGMTASEVVARAAAAEHSGRGRRAGPAADANHQAFQTSLQLKGRLVKPEEFGEIVVKTGADGRITRCAMWRASSLARLDYTTNGFLDGKPAVVLVVSQTPGANALEVANSVKEIDDGAVEELPERDRVPHRLQSDGVHPAIGRRADQDHLRSGRCSSSSLSSFSCRTWRATIIPVVAIPVSLIGTFFVMAALGFSINNLTLFGLVLAVGIVVDDAIVVVENVERKIEHGFSPKDAAFATMDEVGVALDLHRAGALRGLHPHGVPAGNRRPVLPPIRADHRGGDSPIRLQLADAEPSTLRPCASIARGEGKEAALRPFLPDELVLQRASMPFSGRWSRLRSVGAPSVVRVTPLMLADLRRADRASRAICS